MTLDTSAIVAILRDEAERRCSRRQSKRLSIGAFPRSITSKPLLSSMPAGIRSRAGDSMTYFRKQR